MKEEASKQILESEVIKEKFPCYKYAVVFLEAEDIIQRKIGYSLLAPLFKLLPEELQEYISYMWEIDTEKRKMPYSFVKCCEKIFAE
ncbi:MAG: hypothetical protein GOP50_04035 [Candidatus Heimdallarchaeota archaeon]|nr:hypothetical protein [Candidatus Heimdallarchaeota archaeon]